MKAKDESKRERDRRNSKNKGNIKHVMDHATKAREPHNGFRDLEYRTLLPRKDAKPCTPNSKLLLKPSEL